MKMKNLLFVLSVLLIGLSSCKKESDLSNSIPADAFYVVRVDANSLIKKSEYDVFKNPLVQKGINLGKAFMKDNEAKLLDSFLQNANSLGLDLKGEYYSYMTGNQFGLILKVFDAKKLKESLDILGKSGQVEFSDGIYSLKNRGSVIAWNDDKIIFSARFDYDTANNSEDILLTDAKNQLTQTKDKSINSVPQYKTFIAEAKDISLYYAPSKIQGLIKKEENSKEALEVLKEFEGVYIVSYQDFETGKISTSGKYLYDSNDTEKRFKSFIDQFASPIKGDQLKFVPKDLLFLATANLKGNGINKYMDQIKSLDYGYENATSGLKNIQQVLQFVEGDITFAVSDIYKKTVQLPDTLTLNKEESDDFEDDYTPFNDPSDDIAINFVLLADVTNVDSLSNLLQTETEKEVNEFEKISPNIYKVRKDPNNIVYFGLKGNLFFATTIESVYQSVLNDKALENAYVGDVKNKTAFVSGDISKLKTSLITDLGLVNNYYYDPATLTKIMGLAGLFNKFELSVDADTYVMQGNVYLNNTKDNSLKTICLGIDQLISNIAANLF